MRWFQDEGRPGGQVEAELVARAAGLGLNPGEVFLIRVNAALAAVLRRIAV
jgi:hypothetical protein